MQQLTDEQLIQAAKQFGTPLYVYHSEKITEQFNKLTTAFYKPNTKFFYACKALTNISILNHINSLGCNVDCSSINEVKLCIHAGFKLKNILYTSNGIGFDEIEEAKNLGVNITLDSLSNLVKFGERFGNTCPLSLRIRPNIMGGGNIQISTGHDESKFGIPVTQLEQILQIIQQFHINVEGLHIHTGSDIDNIEVFIKGITVLLDIIHHFPNLKFINLGSGFKVKYKEEDKPTDINLLAQKIYENFNNHGIAKDLEIWFEPGKFMVSECGYFIAKVNVIKDNEEAIFASVNSGFNHLIRPMFYGSYHSIKNISNINGVQKEYAVVGNLCETDTFAWKRNIAEINEGDLLCFSNAGAYCFEMSSNFNSRFKPAEILFKNNNPYLIRKRDDFEDLLQNQIRI